MYSLALNQNILTYLSIHLVLFFFQKLYILYFFTASTLVKFPFIVSHKFFRLAKTAFKFSFYTRVYSKEIFLFIIVNVVSVPNDTFAVCSTVLLLPFIPRVNFSTKLLTRNSEKNM